VTTENDQISFGWIRSARAKLTRFVGSATWDENFGTFTSGKWAIDLGQEFGGTVSVEVHLHCQQCGAHGKMENDTHRWAEGILCNISSRSESEKIAKWCSWISRFGGKHRADGRIRMVNGNTVVIHEFGQIVLERDVISMPGDNIERRMILRAEQYLPIYCVTIVHGPSDVVSIDAIG
jgi:hypothetical protein